MCAFGTPLTEILNENWHRTRSSSTNTKLSGEGLLHLALSDSSGRRTRSNRTNMKLSGEGLLHANALVAGLAQAVRYNFFRRRLAPFNTQQKLWASDPLKCTTTCRLRSAHVPLTLRANDIIHPRRWARSRGGKTYNCKRQHIKVLLLMFHLIRLPLVGQGVSTALMLPFPRS